jgi:hypothetical protein
MRWLILLVVAGAVIYGAVKWTTKPAMDIATFVETPEVLETAQKQYGLMSDRTRVTPRVNVNAPETVIRWPAYKSKWVAAVPLELRIRKAQWGEGYQVSDSGFIGPDAVGLRLDWPESAEERADAPGTEEPPLVIYQRSLGFATRDLLYDEEYRAGSEIKFATPLTVPREEAVVIYCGRYGSTNCNMRFEYLGRPAEFNLARRRLEDWEAGHQAARRMLASIATPIGKK